MSPLTHILLAAGLAMQASAATIQIVVGKNGFTFSPNEVTAAVGDVLEFQFPAGGNHSVVGGDFKNPCHPAATGGFFSGYFPALEAANPNVFSVTVNSTDPIPFYCSQIGHCPSGMVGVVNPSGSQTAASFAAAAKSATVEAPPAVFGGVIGPAPQSSAATTSSSAPAATTSASAGGPYGTPGKNDAGALGASLGGMAAALVFALYMA